jgi:hypothetical protein
MQLDQIGERIEREILRRIQIILNPKYLQEILDGFLNLTDFEKNLFCTCNGDTTLETTVSN